MTGRAERGPKGSPAGGTATDSVTPSSEPLLAVRDLRVQFRTERGVVQAATGLTFSLSAGEVLGIVGESGSGKTVSAMAVLGLLPPTARVSGEIRYRGRSVLDLPPGELRALRGDRISIVLQDALSALNPIHRVGQQVAEAIRIHQPKLGRRAIRQRVLELFTLVGIPNPGDRMEQYPHEFSGGMRQRVMIAMALANDPDVIIADEPTTALDVTTQAQVLEMLQEVRRRTHLAMVLITHDLAVVSGVADRVVVMYAGKAVETGPVSEVLGRPEHPYTQGLLASIPRLRQEDGRLARIAGQPPSLVDLPPGCAFHPRCPFSDVPDPCAEVLPLLAPASSQDHEVACHFAGRLTPRHSGPVAGGPPKTAATTKGPLLRVESLVKHFAAHGGVARRRARDVHAVCGVSFEIGEGETLGLVGESGCGKSTVARLLLGLIPATSGAIRLRDHDVVGAARNVVRAVRQRSQIVFQDPYASLDPRMTAGALIEEPLRIRHSYRAEGRERVRELLSMVELDPDDASKYPHQFSGGQQQRVGIARALAVQPELLVLDEPISSLDVSIQAGVMNLFSDLQDRLGVAYLFIAHDLSVIRHISHRVAVMYLGQLVETGTRADIFERPAHPYTQALLSAVPSPDPLSARSRTRIVLQGEVPSPQNPPSGCRFRSRCWKAQEICETEAPALVDRGQGHPVACHFAEVSSADRR